MAGLWSRTQQIQCLAWILVLSFLVHHCLASSLQQQPPVAPASAIQWETSATEGGQPNAQPLPSLRNILRRSVPSGGTKDSTAAEVASTVEVQLSHNLTNSNALSQDPPLTATTNTQEIYDIPNTAESLRTESESSGSRETIPAEVIDSAFLKVKPIKVEPEKERPKSTPKTERTKANLATEDLIDNVDCPECVKQQRKLSKLDPDALRHLRIETIKMQILSKLKFERPPNVTRNEMNIPAPLSEGQFGGGEEELITTDKEIGGKNRYYAKTTQVIITAKNGKCKAEQNFHSSNRCFEISLPISWTLYSRSAVTSLNI